MFCGKRDEFKRGRRTIEKSKNGPVREKSKTAKNKQIEKDRVSIFWYFFVVFDVFFLTFIVFLSVCEKRKAKKRKTLFFYFLGFWCFSFFSVFFLIFLDPKCAQTRRYQTSPRTDLEKMGTLIFFSKPWGFLVFQMLKQSDQEREEQLIQQMKDILEAAMVPIVQPWMAENQLNYSMLHSISKK